MNTVTSPDASRSHTATASKPPGASQQAPTASGRQRHVDEAVDVVERQHEHDAVGGRPAPRRDHPVDLGGEAAVGVHDALRPARRAARVDHQRRPVGRGARSGGRARWRVDVDDGDAAAVGEPAGDVAVGGRGDDRRRAAVGERRRQLGVGVRRVQRHGDRRRRASRRARRRRSRGPPWQRMATRSPWSTARGARRRGGRRRRRRRRTSTPRPGRRSPARSPMPATRSASGTNGLITVGPTSGGRRGREPGRRLQRLGGAQQRRRRRPGAPTSCTPTGRPSASNPAGSDSAGQPVTVIRQHDAIQSM